MIDIKKNHQIIITPLNSPDVESMLKDPYVRDTGFGSLSFGWGVIILVAWISQKVLLRCKDIESILGSSRTIQSQATSICRLASEALVRREVHEPIIVGGNIIAAKDFSITKQDAVKALDLILNPVISEKLKRIRGTAGINKICATNLAGLIKLIDFPIPSISMLLKTLEYNYLVTQPFIDKGIVLSEYTKASGVVAILYGPKLCKYKYMRLETYAAFANWGILDQPMSSIDTALYSVETNDLVEE